MPQIPLWAGILIGVLCLVAGAAVAFLIPFVRNNIAKNTSKKSFVTLKLKRNTLLKMRKLMVSKLSMK